MRTTTWLRLAEFFLLPDAPVGPALRGNAIWLRLDAFFLLPGAPVGPAFGGNANLALDELLSWCLALLLTIWPTAVADACFGGGVRHR